MWYWVKNPRTGKEVDYNHAELKTAVKNGEAELGWEARRHTEKKHHTINYFLEVGDGDEPQNEESNSKQELSFFCVACHCSLRIQMPSGSEIYRCPKCSVIYKTIHAGNNPTVFVLEPQFTKDGTESSDDHRHKSRSLPTEVKKTLKIFGLTESVTLDEIKSAYREQIKAYHPDKVSHLVQNYE
jgi:hypothetical protein